MTEKGLVPDIATMTTLMNAYLKSRNVDKCWELQKYVAKQGIPIDEAYVGVLMQVYSAVCASSFRPTTPKK
jgi:pentatricopeptide repeat protein